jgi:hypothetical protein
MIASRDVGRIFAFSVSPLGMGEKHRHTVSAPSCMTHHSASKAKQGNKRGGRSKERHGNAQF